MSPDKVGYENQIRMQFGKDNHPRYVEQSANCQFDANCGA